MSTLTAYIIDGHDVHIRPAPVERDWMDQSDQRFAYRCLPLNIANAHGWEILCSSAFSAIWDGGRGKESIRVKPRHETGGPALSHFGHGVLTFDVPCLFRTDPGVDLLVTGPINRPKDAIAPLSGVIETDWSPYTFTMNWKFTRHSQRVHFDLGEPFCHVFPVQRGGLEQVEPLLRPISENPALQADYQNWSQGRTAFNTALNEPTSEATREKWQKGYFRGVTPRGNPGSDQHLSRLRLKPFAGK